MTIIMKGEKSSPRYSPEIAASFAIIPPLFPAPSLRRRVGQVFHYPFLYAYWSLQGEGDGGIIRII